MQVASLGDHVCRCMESPVRKLETGNEEKAFSSYLASTLAETPSLYPFPYAGLGLSTMGLGNYPQSPFSMLFPLLTGLGDRNNEWISLALKSNAGQGFLSPGYSYATGWGRKGLLNSGSGFDLRL